MEWRMRRFARSMRVVGVAGLGVAGMGVAGLGPGVWGLAGLGLWGMVSVAWAQGGAEKSGAGQVVATIPLMYATQQNDLNDIQTDLRNMLPKARIYGVASQRAITLSATAEDMATAKKLVAELDRPRKVYRLTYSIMESGGGGKKAKFTLVVAAGEKTDFREGKRVPLVTGSYDTGATKSNSQVQYVDVGLSIEATLEGPAEGLQLKTKVEQSAVAQETSGVGAQDPVILQTRMEGTAMVAPGKPVVLGTMAVPGVGSAAGRSWEIEVMVEGVK